MVINSASANYPTKLDMHYDFKYVFTYQTISAKVQSELNPTNKKA